MSTFRRTSKGGSNSSTINCGYVAPNTAAQSQVNKGIYSLNKRSTVPFVTFQGSGGYNKTISWGELAEVPAGQNVSIRNASYHGGDIFLNQGDDLCNRPSRITVPVDFEYGVAETEEGNQRVWKPKFPCDTRGAKRAYLNIDAYTNPFEQEDGLTIFIRGRKLDGSMKSANSLGVFEAPYGPGVGFLSAINFPVSTGLSYIPLGQGAVMGSDSRPHMLLDAGDVFLLLGSTTSTLDEFLIWPMDTNVFGFPDGAAAFPGTWYVIEYD